MRAEIKYLSIGLFIGMSGTALLLTGMLVPQTVVASLPTDTRTSTPVVFTATPQPSPTTRPPTSTYTATPTLIRIKTATSTVTSSNTPTVPTPTPTHTPTPPLSAPMLELLEIGYISETGPLSIREQIRVYEAALEFIRRTPEDSRLVGEQINGPGYGAPSDICGPLSIAILQDAGLVGPDIDPHDFWLLNPDVWDDRRVLARAFPSERFENTRYKVKLNEADWNETPLYPGDFIYIYAGTGGNFEHMLVVTRVDKEGRAYAVTNHKTEVGFIISEVLLYNPSDPYVGLFPVWTARRNAEMGATGFAGFELWRIRKP